MGRSQVKTRFGLPGVNRWDWLAIVVFIAFAGCISWDGWRRTIQW